MSTRSISVTFVLSLGLLASGAQAEVSYRVQGIALDALHGSTAFGINNLGWVVGQQNAGHGESAFLFRDGHLEELGRLDGRRAELALGINDAGQIVGRTVGEHAFLYDHGVMTDLSAWVAPGAAFNGISHRINQLGQATGVLGNTDENFAFISDGRTGQRIDFPAATNTIGIGINDRGQVAGTVQFTDEPRGRAFVFDGTRAELLPLLASGGKPLEARDINNAGQVTVNVEEPDGHFRAYLYSDGRYTLLNPGEGFAWALNHRGWAVGVAGFPFAGESHAYLYREGRTLDLISLLRPQDALRWTLTTAFDINERGQIVGQGLLQDGRFGAFIATPVSEPGSWALLLAGLVCVGTASRRRQAAAQAAVC
jgi:probable HAF family extracellular repeat protein